MDRKRVLIIGASRGLGFGLSERFLERGWTVTATHRGASNSELEALAARGHDRLHLESVDINDAEQVVGLRERLSGCRFDLVLVNAGTTHDRWETIAEVSTETFERVMVTNSLSPMRCIEQFQDLTSPDGTLAVMSSGQGSITNNTRVTGWEIYRASKSALNQLMRSFAARHPDIRKTLLLLAPGWVRTDMGGPEASLSTEESSAGIADTIEANAGQGGLQFLDHQGQVVPW